MRKRFWVLLVAILVLVIPTIATAKTFVRIGTASMGGGFYSTGIALAQVLNSKLDYIQANAQATGGSATNCNLLAKKEIEFGLAQTPVVVEAYNGTGKFKGRPVKNLRLVTAVYFTRFHIIVNKNSGINSVKDFKGKRIDFGPVGGGIERNTLILLKAYGLTQKDVKAEHLGRSEVAQALKSGRIDATVWATSVPNSHITDMLLSGKCKLIPIEKDKIEVILKEHPELVKSIIPANSYPNQKENIPTVSAIALLLTHKDVPEKLGYGVKKTIFTSLPELRERFKYWKETSLDTALIWKNIPIHPGALKFYKEAGLIK